VEEPGEYGEQRVNHDGGEAERFHRELQQRGIRVRAGMEATGYAHWFERLVTELGFKLWIGDPAEIQAKRVKKRKTDREDARLLLKLMLAGGGRPGAHTLQPAQAASVYAPGDASAQERRQGGDGTQAGFA
jgi:transposase